MFKIVDQTQLPAGDEVIHNLVSFQCGQGYIGGAAMGTVFFTSHIQSVANFVIDGIDLVQGG